MEEQTRQIRFLIAIAAVICAVIIGYNAFYVPDVPLSAPVVAADFSSSVPEEYAPSSVGTESSAQIRASSKTGSHIAGKININTATAQEISEGLKGVGESLAKRIVEYRQKHGPFKSAGEIRNVSGIGPKKYESIQNSITVG